jgi:hypothetical protein
VFRSSFALLGRILVLVTWIGSDAFDTVFVTWIFPLLGLLFLPYATLAFTIAKLADAGIVTVMLSVGLGFALDAASYTLAVMRRP